MTTVYNFAKVIIGRTKGTILDLAKSNLKNADKKDTLDDLIYDFIEKNKDKYAPKKLWASTVYYFVINKIILTYLPDITQFVYDLIKTRIDGVTE